MRWAGPDPMRGKTGASLQATTHQGFAAADVSGTARTTRLMLQVLRDTFR